MLALEEKDRMPEKTITIQVSEETSRDLENLTQEMGWEPEDGLRMVLGAGLMAVRHEQESPSSEAKNKSWLRWLEVEQDLAVTRYRLFREMEANRRWELSTGAVKTQNIAHEKLIENLNKEIDILRVRLKEKE
jgi:hypothetical protein